MLGAAALQGIRDVNEFNKALVSTGGFAGKTAAQLIDLTNQLANGENFNDARDAILALVKSGRLTGDTFDAVAAAATEMAAATGNSAADIVRKFQDARSDVTGLAADLSSSNHSVTASVYEQVGGDSNVFVPAKTYTGRRSKIRVSLCLLEMGQKHPSRKHSVSPDVSLENTNTQITNKISNLHFQFK